MFWILAIIFAKYQSFFWSWSVSSCKIRVFWCDCLENVVMWWCLWFLLWALYYKVDCLFYAYLLLRIQRCIPQMVFFILGYNMFICVFFSVSINDGWCWGYPATCLWQWNRNGEGTFTVLGTCSCFSCRRSTHVLNNYKCFYGCDFFCLEAGNTW